MSALSQFSTFFQGGGPFMFVILGVAVTILAMSLERFWVIGRASAWNGDKLARDLVARLGKGDVSGALETSRKVTSPAGRVATAILSCPARDEESLMNAADGEAAMTLPALSRRLPQISMLANTATLLGLLGTIFGLTTAFAAVGAADPSQRSAFLAAGISQALNTTAFGLIVAVPGMLLHGFLAGRVERIVEQVDSVAVQLIRVLSRGQSAAAPAAVQHHAAAQQAQVTRPVTQQAPGARPAAGRPQPTR
jgi:biopolymer transport protein ExbB/TolQ